MIFTAVSFSISQNGANSEQYLAKYQRYLTLGGITSFAELNRRLPDVAMAIYEHDTTGMAEPFTDIANRLNSVLVDIAHNKSLKENSNILVVTHAFAIKTFLYLFAPEKLCTMDKLKNATILKLLYDGKSFLFEKTDFE